MNLQYQIKIAKNKELVKIQQYASDQRVVRTQLKQELKTPQQVQNKLIHLQIK
jgi:ribonuclease PH